MRLKSAFWVIFAVLLPVTAQSQVLKIATLAPDGTGWMNEMRSAGKEIERLTNNRVKLKFYPGGIMGNEKSVMRKMRIGQLHGSAFTNSILAKIAQENQIYSMPLKFRTYEEMNYVRNKLDHVLLESLQKKGYTAYKIAGDGFAYLLSQHPVKNLADLKQEKVWIPKGDIISRTMLEQVGISPISLPLTDVLTGLQTGLFSTIGATPSFAIALQWHTKVKYLVDMPMFFSYGALVFSNNAIRKIKKADQAVMRKVISKAFDRLNKQNWENNLKAKQALKQQGIKFIKPNAQALQEMRELADNVTHKLTKEGIFIGSMVKDVEQLLTEYRKTH